VNNIIKWTPELEGTPEKDGLQDIMDTREDEVNIRTRWTITIRWIPG
jgi:hypothetical protein